MALLVLLAASVTAIVVAGTSGTLNCTQCPKEWVGDGLCDLTCMTAVCGFDYAPGSGYSPLSDCASACRAKGCSDAQPSNGLCETECNYAECGWDGGDCAVCAKGCKGYSGTTAMLGNGVCDLDCLTAPCGNDFGDCVSLACSSNCYSYMVSDGHCDSDCHTFECSWDGYDCDCFPGCTASLLSNGVCDPLCNSPLCSFDNGKCVLNYLGRMCGQLLPHHAGRWQLRRSLLQRYLWVGRAGLRVCRQLSSV